MKMKWIQTERKKMKSIWCTYEYQISINNSTGGFNNTNNNNHMRFTFISSTILYSFIKQKWIENSRKESIFENFPFHFSHSLLEISHFCWLPYSPIWCRDSQKSPATMKGDKTAFTMNIQCWLLLDWISIQFYL